jgi:hypothetical protein
MDKIHQLFPLRLVAVEAGLVLALLQVGVMVALEEVHQEVLRVD